MNIYKNISLLGFGRDGPALDGGLSGRTQAGKSPEGGFRGASNLSQIVRAERPDDRTILL
jgi:hypothetical protein